MAFIYVITNQINGKQYVGKTTHSSIEDRWKEHIRDKNKRVAENRPLYRALNKYGIENFTIEELEECSIEDSSNREIYWIDKLGTYHNGYNATIGGDGKNFYDYKKIAAKYLELQNKVKTAEFFSCDSGTVKRACDYCKIPIKTNQEVNAKQLSKSVVMLDKDTEEPLHYFSSLVEAGIFLGDKTKGAHIGKVCNGKRTIAYGYKWRYAK